MGLAENHAREKETIWNSETQLKTLTSTVQKQTSTIDSLQRQLDEAKREPKSEDKARSSESEYGVPTLNGIARPAYSLISIEAGTSDELKDLQLEVQRLQKELDSKSADQHAPLPDHPKLTQEMKDFIASVKSGRKVVDDNVDFQEWFMRVISEGREQGIEAEKVHQHKSLSDTDPKPSYQRHTIASFIKGKSSPFSRSK